MFKKGRRTVDPFDRCYSDDRGRRPGVEATPLAHPVIHCDGLAFEVHLDASNSRPPVGAEPCAVPGEPGDEPVGGDERVAPPPVPPQRWAEADSPAAVD
jgi:hypothetical protein